MLPIRPYAGFWKRFAAYILDGIIIAIPLLMLFIPLMIYLAHQTGNVGEADKAVQWMAEMRSQQYLSGIRLLSFVLSILYFAWMESSKLQASLGKMIMGIKVVDGNGNRQTFWQAVGRNAGKIISGLTFNIGYLMAGATRRKQALHDKLANAYVVDKDFQPGDELPEVEPRFGVLGTVIALMVLSFFLFIGLLVGLIVYAAQHEAAKHAAQHTQTTQIEQTIHNTSSWA